MNGPEQESLPVFFSGPWALERTVVQRDGPVTAVAEGRAFFSAAGPGELLYHEEGSVTLQPGSRFSFFRSYTYRFSEGVMQVFFADGPDAGTLYQSYAFKDRRDRLELLAVHHCGADVYAGCYELTGTDHFYLVTSVKGPKKDFEITTLFSRREKCAAASTLCGSKIPGSR